MAYLLVVFQAALAIAMARPQASPADLQAYTADPAASDLYVGVHRAGLLSFLGHDHAVIPMDWSADLCLADSIPEGARAGLVIQTGSLVIDSDSARVLAHMGGGPGDDSRDEIQERMLGPEFLSAQDFPEVRLSLSASAPAASDRVQVSGTVTVHGVTKDVALPVKIERGTDGALVLSGTLRIRLRDFGMEPESRAGLVKVSNDVDLHVLLTARPTGRPCAAPPV